MSDPKYKCPFCRKVLKNTNSFNPNSPYEYICNDYENCANFSINITRDTGIIIEWSAVFFLSAKEYSITCLKKNTIIETYTDFALNRFGDYSRDIIELAVIPYHFRLQAPVTKKQLDSVIDKIMNKKLWMLA